MKLFYTPNSPYARTARIALREYGLLATTEEAVAANREPDNPVLAFNPVGRVPTLVAGGLVITEAPRIFAYIRQVSGKSMPRPETVSPDWEAVAQEGQILGFLEGIAFWVRENRRPVEHRSASLIDVEIDRAGRCLAHLNGNARRQHLPDVTEFRGAALAAALDLMDLHRLKPAWRTEHEALSAWLQRQASRSSLQQTVPKL
jgi:glutathione S-transferase